MKLVKASSCFKKEFKIKKVFAFQPSDLIMVENLKIIPLKPFAMKMTFLITSLLLELHSKME